MADFVEFGRSNYFKVKDREEFLRGLPGGVDVREKEDRIALIPEDYWPTTIDGETDEDTVDFNIATYVGQHLVEGEVAVFMTIGYEGLRYLVGFAEAVNWEGEFIIVSLNDIYDEVHKAWGFTPGLAEY